MTSRLRKLAEQDLAMARDNLARARSAAYGRDASLQWGQSGQTLNEIIQGYEKWEREALETLAEVDKREVPNARTR